MRLFFLIFFALIFFNSCNSDNGSCLKSPGSKKTIKINPGHFENLSINSMFDVTLVDSTDYSISITTGENLISLIKYEIKDNELIIKNTNKCAWLTKTDMPEIIVSAPDLKMIKIHSACDLRSQGTLNYPSPIFECLGKIFNANLNLNCESMWFKVNSATGTYFLEGNGGYAFIQNAGNGYLHAENLNCYHIDLIHESMGDTWVYATSELVIGKIRYGEAYLITDECPTITFRDEESKKHFFSDNCITHSN